MREKLTNQGFELLPQMPPGEFAALIRTELAKWVPIVRSSGAGVD